MYLLTTLLLAALLAPSPGPAGRVCPVGGGPHSTSVTPIGSLPATESDNSYTIRAVVTGVYRNLSPAGFYVQEPAGQSDGDPATSDAIFVAQTNPLVQAGDVVQVGGVVQKSTLSPGTGQLMFVPRTEARVLSSGHELPPPLPLSMAAFRSTDLQACAGMRVKFTMLLTVSDVYSLKRWGQVTLTTGGRVYQPTQFVDPNDEPAIGVSSTGGSNVPAIRACEESNDLRAIVLDNAGNEQLEAGAAPFLDARTSTLRTGSTIRNVCGVLSLERGRWHLHAGTGDEQPVFAVQRPALPRFGPLDVKLASFNVYNYFNGDGQGGGFPAVRGARTATEFALQRAKIVQALVQLNADIIGLTEVENDGNGPHSAAQDLLAALNNACGQPAYALINDGGATAQPNNSDAIHCVLLYKPAVVLPLGGALVDATPGIFERPPVAQVFQLNKPRGENFAVIINHFKSRLAGTGADADLHDGQGGCNDRRRQQARELVQFVRGSVLRAGTSKVICIGDYNANYEEDPIDILRAAGYVVATPPSSASYVYKGNTGSLDHCLISPGLVGFVDVKKWNINSAEPSFLDFTQSSETPATATPWRSSDHDPVLIGVRFLGIASAATLRPPSRLVAYSETGTATGSFQLASAMPPDTRQLSMEFELLNGQPMLRMQGQPQALQSQLGRFTAHLAPGIYRLRLKGQGFDIARQVVKE